MFTPFTVASGDDPAQVLLRGYLLVLEADHYLDGLGLSWQSVIRGLQEIDTERALAGSDADGEYVDDTGYLRGPRARFYATAWWAHGFSIDQVATLIGRQCDMHDQLVAELDHYLTSRPTAVSERAVLELHRAGMAPGDIAKKLMMHRNTVDNALRRLAMKPNLKQPRIVETIRHGVIADRNRGMTYPDLRRKYNLTTNQVRSILRHAANQGLIKNYGVSDAS